MSQVINYIINSISLTPIHFPMNFMGSNRIGLGDSSSSFPILQLSPWHEKPSLPECLQPWSPQLSSFFPHSLLSHLAQSGCPSLRTWFYSITLDHCPLLLNNLGFKHPWSQFTFPTQDLRNTSWSGVRTHRCTSSIPLMKVASSLLLFHPLSQHPAQGLIFTLLFRSSPPLP